MTNPTPYWGTIDLPPAVIVQRQNSLRKGSVGNGNNGPSLQKELPTESQPQPRPERISMLSQASTQSPFASPVDSTFRADGLAPRPSSYQYGIPDPYNKESLERRRKRASREKAQQQYEATARSGTLLAAPGVPRQAPPASYRQPYSNGEGSLNPRGLAKSHAGRDQPEYVERAMPNIEDNYQHGSSGATERERKHLNINTGLGRSNTTGKLVSSSGGDNPERLGIRRGSVQARKERPEIRRAVTGSQSRRGSAATEVEAQRPREWAHDRSPLQRLELTLDSITKEEKRARVEQAELLAREAKAGRGEQTAAYSRNRPPAVAKVESQTLPEAGLTRSLTSKQQGDLQRASIQEEKKPDSAQPTANIGKGFEYEPQPQPQAESSFSQDEVLPGIQRGQSFRDRAGASLGSLAAGALAVGATLQRRTSNKLKKAPPGDPWHSRGGEGEKQFNEVIAPSRPSIDVSQEQRERSAGLQGFVPTNSRSREPDAALQFDQPTRRNTSHPLDIAELMSDENLDTMPKPKRSNSRNVEQLGVKFAPDYNRAIAPQQQQLYADRLYRSGELGPGRQHEEVGGVGKIKTVNGIEYAIPAAATTENYGQEQVAVGPDGHHYFSKIVHAGRDRRHPHQPGTGLYAPGKRLDEWKRGGVAFLTATMLDVKANQTKQTEAEKDKTWWEAGNTGKRRPSTAEAIHTFDSSHETQNGIVPSILLNSVDDEPTVSLHVAAART